MREQHSGQDREIEHLRNEARPVKPLEQEKF